MSSIVMFSKAPELGKVKTRLTNHMSELDAASFHEAFVLDTLDTLAGIVDVKKYIACHPDREHTFFHKIEECFDVKTFNQVGKDLGERMENAFYHLREEGHKEIVIIGSDSPTLPAKLVEEAFERLKEHQVVIGPSLDGGYYLIGGAASIPDLFGGIEWGTDMVFAETLRKAQDMKLDISILPFWYDIDTVKDLRFMAIHLDALSSEKNMRTREMIKRFEEKITYTKNGGRP